MGDIVSLVEKAADAADLGDAEKIERKIKKGEFDFEDLADQIRKLRKMGGLSSIMGLIPGIGKIKKQIDAAGVDEKIIDRQLAIINSMTRKERRAPKLLNASRKRRIAVGSGTTIQEINRLIKQHQQMSGMMKKFAGMDKKQLMRGGLAGLLGQS
jgi:signal recognition particle subunit SRP54